MKVYIFHYRCTRAYAHTCVYDCGCSSQKTIPGIGPDLSPQLKQSLSFAGCRIPQASWPTDLQGFSCLPSLQEHQHRNTMLWLASTWDLGIQTQAVHWQENLLHTEPSPQTSSYFCAVLRIEPWPSGILGKRSVTEPHPQQKTSTANVFHVTLDVFS